MLLPRQQCENQTRMAPVPDGEANRAFHEVRQAIQRSEKCANDWHLTLLWAAMDEGVDRDTGNRVARRFMRHYFNVSTSDQ